MAVKAPDVREVQATREEIEAWWEKYPRRYPPYRVACRACGKRMWLSGIGLGAHRRACPGGGQYGGENKLRVLRVSEPSSELLIN